MNSAFVEYEGIKQIEEGVIHRSLLAMFLAIVLPCSSCSSYSSSEWSVRHLDIDLKLSKYIRHSLKWNTEKGNDVNRFLNRF